jgi:hypothetical protein
MFPRIEQGNFNRVIDGVSGDEDQVVGKRGGGNQAVKHRQAAALALMPGAEPSPFAHDLAGRRQQAVFGPAVQAFKPRGDFLFAFARREKFDPFDDFAVGNRGEVGFVIVRIQPVHDRFIRLGIRGLAQDIGIEQETHVIRNGGCGRCPCHGKFSIPSPGIRVEQLKVFPGESRGHIVRLRQ